MRRREFLSGLSAAAMWPGSAEAQKRFLVGFLSSRSAVESSELIESFRRGLRQIGLHEGQDFSILFKWADGQYERLSGLAAELVNLSVNAIFAAGGSPAAMAAKAATSTIPVVFLTSDPVSLGLVGSLSHPGGNVTGISNLATDLPGKSTTLLKQLIPDAKAAGYLLNRSNLSAFKNAEQAVLAARALGIELHLLYASTLQELDDVFGELAKRHIVLLQVMADAFFDSQRLRIVQLSTLNGIAGCYPWRDYVVEGGMMSYGTPLSDSYRQAGIYVGRLLRGEKPSDLPVMQPTKIELALNLTTARKLGVVIPPTLLAIADEVLE